MPSLSHELHTHTYTYTHGANVSHTPPTFTNLLHYDTGNQSIESAYVKKQLAIKNQVRNTTLTVL